METPSIESVSRDVVLLRRLRTLTPWTSAVGGAILASIGLADDRVELGPRAIHVAIVSGGVAVWLCGIGVGIWVWRQCRKAKEKVPKAIFGTVGFNVLAIGLTLWGTVAVGGMMSEAARWRAKARNEEEARVRAKVGDGEALQRELSALAVQEFAMRAREEQRKFESAARMLTNPPVLDMALVKAKEDLAERKETVKEVIEASKVFLKSHEHVYETFEDALLRHNLSKKTRETMMKEFKEQIEGSNAKVLLLRNLDLRRCELTLEMLKFLESNWGKWEHIAERDTLRFENDQLLEKYKRMDQEAKDLFSRVGELQSEVRKTVNR